MAKGTTTTVARMPDFIPDEQLSQYESAPDFISDEEMARMPQEQVDVKLDFNPPEETLAGRGVGYGPVGHVLREAYRPVLEGLGAGAGGLAGAALGPLGAVGGGGLGFAAGRAAANTIDQLRGQGAGRGVGEQLAEVPGNVLEGAAYEMVGPVAGQVARGWRHLRGFLYGPADDRVVAKAGRKLQEFTSPGARYQANEDEARAIEEATGARFTRGERRNDPKAIAFERGQAVRGGEFAVHKKEQQAQLNNALREFFGREFSQGEVDDLLKFIDAKAQGLQSGVKSAEGSLRESAVRVRPASTSLDRGAAIQKGLESAKQSAKAEVKAAYDQVPGDTPVNIEALAAKVKNLRHVGESLIPNYEREHTIPSILSDLSAKLNKTAKAVDDAAMPDLGPDLIDVVIDEGGILAKSQVKPGEVGSGMYDSFEGIPRWITSKTGRQLDDLRQSLSERGYHFDTVDELKDAIREVAEYRASSSGSEPLYADFRSLRNLRSQNLAAIRDAEARGDQTVKTGKLKQLQAAIDEAIDSLAEEGGKPEVVEAYRKASAAYRDYSEKFKQGAVAEVLQRGPRGEASKIAPERVAGLFTSPKRTTAIEQLKRAGRGAQEITQAVRDELSDNLLQFADDGQGGLAPAKVTLWFKKNQEVLRRHGLRGAYADVEKSAKGLQGAQGRLDEFSKSFSAKTIDAVDASRAMEAAFEGRGQRRTAAVAQDILKAVKGDAKATAGAQRAFSDMLWRKMQNTGTDLAENRVMSVAKMTNVLDQYKPAIQVFYSGQPAKIEALAKVQRGFAIANRSNIPITSGSDTAEKIGAVAAGFAGRVVTNKLAGYPLFRGIYEYVQKRDAKHIEQLLMRATFDPDFAQTLLWASQKYPKALIQRRLNHHWETMGLAATGSALTQDEP